jgi:hypothetical protein
MLQSQSMIKAARKTGLLTMMWYKEKQEKKLPVRTYVNIFV